MKAVDKYELVDIIERQTKSYLIEKDWVYEHNSKCREISGIFVAREPQIGSCSSVITEFFSILQIAQMAAWENRLKPSAKPVYDEDQDFKGLVDVEV